MRLISSDFGEGRWLLGWSEIMMTFIHPLHFHRAIEALLGLRRIRGVTLTFYWLSMTIWEQGSNMGACTAHGRSAIFVGPLQNSIFRFTLKGVLEVPSPSAADVP